MIAGQYPLLDTCVALEAILLASFILMRHPDLQSGGRTRALRVTDPALDRKGGFRHRSDESANGRASRTKENPHVFRARVSHFDTDSNGGPMRPEMSTDSRIAMLRSSPLNLKI
jgi:hypothetical protein